MIWSFTLIYSCSDFQTWDDPNLLPHVHDTSTYLKLNFRLHIYFCCRKLAEELAPATECLQSIRDFFDREGTALSNEQEFIHFFALPFVAEPQTHPSFKILFEVNQYLFIWGRGMWTLIYSGTCTQPDLAYPPCEPSGRSIHRVLSSLSPSSQLDS